VRHHLTPHIGLALVALTLLLATLGMAGSAGAGAATSCSEIQTVYGIPPWGFHTGWTDLTDLYRLTAVVRQQAKAAFIGGIQ
jgi:hypothetical protein